MQFVTCVLPGRILLTISDGPWYNERKRASFVPIVRHKTAWFSIAIPDLMSYLSRCVNATARFTKVDLALEPDQFTGRIMKRAHENDVIWSKFPVIVA